MDRFIKHCVNFRFFISVSLNRDQDRSITNNSILTDEGLESGLLILTQTMVFHKPARVDFVSKP